MDTTYWYKQTDQPLFPELEWNKPERRDQTGRLLIIGGNQHNLSAPARAFEVSKQTGIGEIQLALPGKTKRLVGSTLPGALFLPSTPSGELSQKAAPELAPALYWADTLLFPGDLGRNSQTTILLEQILHSANQPAVITRDALDSLKSEATFLCNRPNTYLVASFAQLQKLVTNLGAVNPLTFSIDLVKLTEYLHTLTLEYPVSLATCHNDQLIIASKGKISSTKVTEEVTKDWRTHFAAVASCYLTWNPTKPFECLTEAAFQVSATK